MNDSLVSDDRLEKEPCFIQTAMSNEMLTSSYVIVEIVSTDFLPGVSDGLRRASTIEARGSAMMAPSPPI
jgi:hypothetical protein